MAASNLRAGAADPEEGEGKAPPSLCLPLAPHFTETGRLVRVRNKSGEIVGASLLIEDALAAPSFAPRGPLPEASSPRERVRQSDQLRLRSLTGPEGGHLAPQSLNYASLSFPPRLAFPFPPSPFIPENLWLRETLASLGLYPRGLPTSAPEFGEQRGNRPKKSLQRWEPPACCLTLPCKCAACARSSFLPFPAPGILYPQPRAGGARQRWGMGVPWGCPHLELPCLPKQVLAAIDSLLSNAGRHPCLAPNPHPFPPHLEGGEAGLASPNQATVKVWRISSEGGLENRLNRNGK